MRPMMTCPVYLLFPSFFHFSEGFVMDIEVGIVMRWF